MAQTRSCYTQLGPFDIFITQRIVVTVAIIWKPVYVTIAQLLFCNICSDRSDHNDHMETRAGLFKARLSQPRISVIFYSSLIIKQWSFFQRILLFSFGFDFLNMQLKISFRKSFKPKKLNPRLYFNPGLALIGFRTTEPRFYRYLYDCYHDLCGLNPPRTK